MRQYSKLELEMQEAFERVMPLTKAQSGRLTQLCRAAVEADDLDLSKLARILPHQTLQGTREEWIRRLLKSPFLTQSHLYQPMLKSALAEYNLDCWHVICDRTGLPEQDHDMVMISLHYNGRAVPVYWELVAKGGTEAAVYYEIIKQVAKILPSSPQIVFHADSEFGSTSVLNLLKRLSWDFIVGVRGHHHLYDPKTETSQAFQDYDIPDQGTSYMPDVTCFKSAPIPVNAFAFKQAHHSGGQKRREYQYLVTSLPLTSSIRRIGRRRWGTEPLFKDYKSAGWEVDQSYLTTPQCLQSLLVVLAICYLWLVTCGKWLSKVGRRREVDQHQRRHYSLFRIGWDWIVHKFKLCQPIPYPLMLYG